MNDFIEFDEEKDGTRRLKINPHDTLEDIARKMLECKRLGVRVTATLNGVTIDSNTFNSMNEMKSTLETAMREKQKENESTKGNVGSFPNEEKDVTSQANISNSGKQNETVSYIEVKENESIESVAANLEACAAQGIKAVAVYNDVVLNNVETSSANEIISTYKKEQDKEEALKGAGIILEKGFRFESKFKVNARQIRVGKYDRIQEIIQKLKFCKEHGIEAYVNFNGVELNTYDYLKFRLDDPYRIMAWYNKQQDSLKEQKQQQKEQSQVRMNTSVPNEAPAVAINESQITDVSKSVADSAPISNEASEVISQGGSLEGISYENTGKTMLNEVAIAGNAYNIGKKIDIDNLDVANNQRIERRESPRKGIEPNLANTSENVANDSENIPKRSQNPYRANGGGRQGIPLAPNELAKETEYIKQTVLTSDKTRVGLSGEELGPKRKKLEVSIEAKSDSKKQNKNNRNRLLYNPSSRTTGRRTSIVAPQAMIEDDDDEENTSEGINEAGDTPQNGAINGNNPENNNANQPNPKNGGNQKKKKKGLDWKKLIFEFIKKHPYVLAGVGAAFAFLLILMFFLETTDQKADVTYSPNYSESCDAIDIHRTSMTREEFISKTQSYYGRVAKDYSSTFSTNAGTIYDIATKNGINPEMVIIRAESEGYSPGASKNNYWGMGCTNTGGYEACINYTSFADGVLGYVKNISKYDTVSAMMSKYAYIGSYWYKNAKGGSSKGGCYYYEYIKSFMSQERADEVENICAANSCNFDGSGNCTATTDEDQLAYAKWQVYKMAQSRERIFGIPPDECKSPDVSGGSAYTAPGCVIYGQSDPRWGDIPLGKSSTNMRASGCAVTSIAIGIKCSGTQISVNNFDAGVFIRKLNQAGCFTPGGGIYWSCSAITEIAPRVKNVANLRKDEVKNYSSEQKITAVTSFDPSQYFVLVHFVNSEHPRGHYVVYSSVSGSNFVVKDPAKGGTISQVPIKDVDQIVVYSY